jgi:hypothetical protein
MDSDRDHPDGWGCPIRRSSDQRPFAAPRSFSQRTTSFVASWHQGIHQTPLRRLISFSSGRATPRQRRAAASRAGVNPRTEPLLPADEPAISRQHARRTSRLAPSSRCPSISGRTRRARPKSHRQSGLRSQKPEGQKFLASDLLISDFCLVEADGIEPTTSCLQSRRSPD